MWYKLVKVKAAYKLSWLKRKSHKKVLHALCKVHVSVTKDGWLSGHPAITDYIDPYVTHTVNGSANKIKLK